MYEAISDANTKDQLRKSSNVRSKQTLLLLVCLENEITEGKIPNIERKSLKNRLGRT